MRRMGFGKITLIIMVIFMLLSVCRIGWTAYHQPSSEFTAKNGVIDLKDASFTDRSLYTLDGEWTFYPGEFVEPGSGNDAAQSVIQVPSDWNDALDNDQQVDVYGSGTYQLTIKLPEDDQSSYGLRFINLATAGDVYINGEKIGSYNKTADSPGTKGKTRGPFVVPFHTDENRLNVIVHVSNFNHPLNGGLSDPVTIGTQTAVNKETQYFTTLQIIVSVIYFLHSLYAFALWLLSRRKNNRELLFYAIMAVLAGVTILIDDETVVQLPFRLNISANIMLFLMNSTLLSMLLFIKHLFKLKSRAYYFFYSIFALFCIAQLVVPYEYLSIISSLIGIYYLSTIGYLFVQTIKMIRQGINDAMLVLLFVTSYSSNALWGAAIKADVVNFPYYPFDFIISILAIAFILLSRQQRVMALNRQQTKQLQEADRQKDIFLANTSHELRTPLHGMLNIAELLKEDPGRHLSQQHHHYLNTLTQIAQQMTFTLNDLLDASRLQEKGIRLYRKQVDLRSAATAVFDMAHLFSGQKDLELKLRVSSSFPDLYADENRTTQILFNLIHNAIKYTNQGSITLSAELDQTGTMALIHVSDTGRGIDPDHLETIFKPYEQGSHASNEGIGLGLSVTRQLVELHGGFIRAESELNKGTTITFSIPVAVVEARTGAEETAAASIETDVFEGEDTLAKWEMPEEKVADAPNKPSNILIVEDDPINLKVLETILAQTYRLTSSTSISEAFEWIHRRNDWDLIISDVMMPDMSGYEFTRIVRETYSMAELPIILLTARQQQEDIYTGFMAGANDYVTKPVTAVEIKARAGALTSLKHSVQEQLRTEAAWLQAQIRPHFLFNTLNTIAALSEIDTGRMVKLLNTFGNYLRKSFEVYNASELISFDAEAELIESYLYIEKERFGDRLHVEWEVDGHTDVRIPPLSVQPLVENAIRHGVLKRQTGGTIWIRLFGEANEWCLEVEDDGVGMNEDEIEEMRVGNQTGHGSVGFSNTDKRLRQQFGEGLEIKSEQGKGTRIYFHVPE